jgi:pimeloyl-ACP methyl ester carboxylesterase
MARVVFFQGLGACMHQVNRVRNVLFPSHLIQMPKEDLPEIAYLRHPMRVPWFWWPVHLCLCLCMWLFRAPHFPYSLLFWRLNIGQSRDIQALIERDQDVPATELISFGISRGALVTFIRHATNPDRKARLVLLEGCPASIPATLDYRYGRFLARCVEWLLCHFTRYNLLDATYASPLAMADMFPKDVPVAFVTSERDTSVPAQGTRDLVETLKRFGHTKVHMLVLKDAGHDTYLTASERDRRAYLEFVESLCVTYNIPISWRDNYTSVYSQ